MAKQVIWSLAAQKDRKNILEYWIIHNGSNSYSIKLDKLFRYSIELISRFPLIGRKIDMPNIRAKVVRNYVIVYEIKESHINILTLWDSRQNPIKLKKILTHK